MSRVVVVGGANWDRAWRLGRLPAAGETVAGELAGEGPGGKGLNIAVGVARLREEVALVARLGGDADGRRLAAFLAEEEVLVAGLGAAAEGEATGSAAIWLTAAESTIVVATGAN